MANSYFSCNFEHDGKKYHFFYQSHYKYIEISLHESFKKLEVKIRYKKFRPSLQKKKISKMLESLIKNLSKNKNCEIDSVSINNICELINYKEVLNIIDIKWKEHNVNILKKKIEGYEYCINKFKNSIAKIETW